MANKRSQLVIIDVSNLAHTSRRRGPSFRHFQKAFDALRHWIDMAEKKFFLIADATLPHRVPDEEKAEVQAALKKETVRCVPSGCRADGFILQYADAHNAIVVSNDKFRQYHGRYTWLLDHPSRLVVAIYDHDFGWAFEYRRLGNAREPFKKASKPDRRIDLRLPKAA